MKLFVLLALAFGLSFWLTKKTINYLFLHKQWKKPFKPVFFGVWLSYLLALSGISIIFSNISYIYLLSFGLSFLGLCLTFNLFDKNEPILFRILMGLGAVFISTIFAAIIYTANNAPEFTSYEETLETKTETVSHNKRSYHFITENHQFSVSKTEFVAFKEGQTLRFESCTNNCNENDTQTSLLPWDGTDQTMKQFSGTVTYLNYEIISGNIYYVVLLDNGMKFHIPIEQFIKLHIGDPFSYDVCVDQCEPNHKAVPDFSN